MADIKEITAKLEVGVKAVYSSDNYLSYLRTMAKFHDYSLNNSILIYIQRPDATMVAGFKAWQKKFKRNVKKGEKGIAIIAPSPHKYTEIITNEEGQKETVERSWTSFRVAYVFDISQTEGEDIPTICKELSGDVDGYESLIEKVKEIAPCPITFGDTNGAKGLYNRLDNLITVRDGMSQAQTIKTLIHELTHSILHKDSTECREVKEIQAESVAFVVCNALGIQTDDYSFEYVADWSRGQEAQALNDNMEIIRSTADRLIGLLS